MAIKNILGGFTPAKPKTQTPLVTGMIILPDISGIQWYVGGGQNRYDARPEDPEAWAFVYKYDATTKKSTDLVRDECAPLVAYLKEHDKLEADGYTYIISGKDKNFLGRKKV